jgi:hypothetical protein
VFLCARELRAEDSMKKILMGWMLVWSAMSALGLASTQRTVRPLLRSGGPAHKKFSSLEAGECTAFQALEETAFGMRKAGKQEKERPC